MESIKEQVLKMSEEQLIDLNNLVCSRLNSLRAEKNIKAAANFSTGDIVSFNSSNRRYPGKKTIVIDKLTGTKIHGHETGGFHTKWTVPPAFCKLEKKMLL